MQELGLLCLLLTALSIESKVIYPIRPASDFGEIGKSDQVDVPSHSRERRSYFWVEDGSDKVTIIESKHLRRALEDYKRKVHAAEEAVHRVRYEEPNGEYSAEEEAQEHTPLFVPNLFG